MKKVLSFLNSNPVVHFATVGDDGKPKVRPFQFMLEKNGKLYFCTSNRKDVYAQIKKNPYVEFCASNTSFEWMRTSGKVVFSNDNSIKKEIIENNSMIKNIYKSADNPIFEIFYLDEAKAVIYDFSGNPPRSFSL